jgi:hypothetical protein
MTAAPAAACIGAPSMQLRAECLRAACQVYRAIITYTGGASQFARAGQNIAAAAMLLCNLPEPADPQQQELHRNIRTLVEGVAMQHAESYVSRHQQAASCVGVLPPCPPRDIPEVVSL